MVAMAAMTTVLVLGHAPDRISELAVIVAGGQAAIIGVLLMCYQGLLRRTSSNQELYRVGYDNGYDDGYDLGHAAPRPVIVDLESRRVRCPECDSKASSSAPRVVDRV
jgi:hypothetical protein